MEDCKLTSGLYPRGEGEGFYRKGDPGEECYITPSHPKSGPRTSITPSEAAILKEMAAGKQVLEIGTGTGYSTKALSESAAFLVTLDNSPWVRDEVFPLLPKNIVTVFNDWNLVVHHGPYDLIFIDACHDEDAVLSDRAKALAILLPGGMIVAHDGRHISTFRNPKLKFDAIIPTRYGLGVWRAPANV